MAKLTLHRGTCPALQTLTQLCKEITADGLVDTLKSFLLDCFKCSSNIPIFNTLNTVQSHCFLS